MDENRLEKMNSELVEMSGDEKVTVTVVELQELLQLAKQSGVPVPSPIPATEEGPHLKDPDIRRLKREHMEAAGMTASDKGLTDDMRDILKERGRK